MGIGDNVKTTSKAKKEEGQPLRKITPIKWHQVTFKKSAGKNLAIIGEPKVGRSTLSWIFAYFNSEYKNLIKDGGYKYVLEALNSGLLPEIEQIIVLEPEDKLETSIQDGIRKALVKPFVDKGIMFNIPFPIERKELEIKDGALSISQDREYFETRKKEFVVTLKAILNDFGENTLFIIDTMSHFKKLLDDKFGLLYDALNKRNEPTAEGAKPYQQSYYANRDTWWENVMAIKQSWSGWNVDVYKEKPIPEHYQKPGEDPFSIKWVPGTMHFLNMAYRVYKDVDGNRQIEIYDGEFLPKQNSDFFMRYQQDTKMGAMPILDRLCKVLIEGEKSIKD